MNTQIQLYINLQYTPPHQNIGKSTPFPHKFFSHFHLQFFYNNFYCIISLRIVVGIVVVFFSVSVLCIFYCYFVYIVIYLGFY